MSDEERELTARAYLAERASILDCYEEGLPRYLKDCGRNLRKLEDEKEHRKTHRGILGEIGNGR